MSYDDNNPRAVAFNPTTQLFTNEKRDIAFKSYNEADAWNKSKFFSSTNQIITFQGCYDKPKPIIKKKKPYKIEPVQINFSPMPPMPYEPIAPDPYALELERRVRENIRKTEDEKRLNNSSGLAGLIGGFKQ